LNEDGLFDATSVAGSEGGGSGASETEAGKLSNKHQSKKRTSEESKTETAGGGGLKTRYFTVRLFSFSPETTKMIITDEVSFLFALPFHAVSMVRRVSPLSEQSVRRNLP